MDENIIIRLEEQRVVTATFRKLAPGKKKIIYRAALNAFGSKVFEQVILDEIAGAAEISKGSLIQYFLFKENILRFVSEIVIEDYRNYWENYFLSETVIRAKERLERFFLHFAEYFRANKMESEFIYRMRYDRGHSFSLKFSQELASIERDYFRQIIERGIQTGQLRRDLKIGHTVLVMHALFTALMEEYFLNNSESGEKVFKERTDKCLNLILEGIK